MTMLEDALRETFTGRVADVPAVLDPAGTAIRRARALRRRQQAVAGTALALAVTLMVSGPWWVRSAAGTGRSPEPMAGAATGLRADQPAMGPVGAAPAEPPSSASSPPSGSALKLDLFNGSTILTADGRGLPIADVAAGTSVDRVPDGWLYTSASARTRLLRADGTSVDVGIDGEQFVVSADGTRVAWMAARPAAQPTLKLAELTGDYVRDVVTTPVPVGTSPVALVGGRVVVASKQGYDYWDPSQLIFKPTWNGTVREVLGQYGDLAVATVDAGPGGSDSRQGGCLALFSLAGDGLHDTRQTCQPIGLSGQLPDVLSPTGRWLAIANGRRAQLVDLSTVFDRPSGPSCVFPSSVENMAWEDDGHLVVRTSSGWQRCATDAAVTSVDTTARAADSWTLVSRSG